MDWLTKINSLADSTQPADWSKFGDILKSQQNNQQEEFIADLIIVKKPVFNARAAFWITAIIVGGSYMLIEGVTYEGAVNKAIDFINEEIEKEEYTATSTEEAPNEFKLLKNKELGIEIKIPDTMIAQEEEYPDYVSFVSSKEMRGSESRMIIITKRDVTSEPKIDSYSAYLASIYRGQDFTLKEESVTELNGLPAKKYVYESGDENGKFGEIDIILKYGDVVYTLSMLDTIPKFYNSLSEFETSSESFVLK